MGDRLVLTFSEPVEPLSILDGWDGSPAPVVVRLRNALVGNHDGITVHDASSATQASLGKLSLGLTNYVTADRAFGATGETSTIAMSASAVTITLGTASGSTIGAGSAGTMSWRPEPGPFNRAGNPMGTSAVTGSGSADREF